MDADLFSFDELHFVNVGDWNKLKSSKSWVKFEDEAKRRLDVQLRLNPQMAYYKALMDDDNIWEALSYWRDLRTYVDISELTKAQLARPFGRVATLFEEHLANVTPEQRKLVPFIEAKLPAGVRTAQIKSGFEKKQAHLRYLLDKLCASNATARDIIRNHL